LTRPAFDKPYTNHFAVHRDMFRRACPTLSWAGWSTRVSIGSNLPSELPRVSKELLVDNDVDYLMFVSDGDCCAHHQPPISSLDVMRGCSWPQGS
jgi:hypothetical protein